MRIARLLIYEGTEEALEKHFAHTFARPGATVGAVTSAPQEGRVRIWEDPPTGAGGRVELLPGEIAAIKVVK